MGSIEASLSPGLANTETGLHRQAREGVKVSRNTAHAALRSIGYTLPVAPEETKRRVGRKSDAASGRSQG